MIKSILKFLWRRDSESATILATDLGTCLNDADLACMGRTYHRVAQSEKERQWYRVYMRVARLTVIWFGFRRSFEGAFYLTCCLPGDMTLKDLQQTGDYYMALAESRRNKQ